MTENDNAGPGDPALPSASPTAEELLREAAESGHPDPSAYARFALGNQLAERGEAHAAARLYREAAGSTDAETSGEARIALGELLKRQGDDAGARAAWQAVIDGPGTRWWRDSAYINLVNLLRKQGDLDGLRVVYRDGTAQGHREALYALEQIGVLLQRNGDVPGAHAAWQEAIDQGSENADFLLDLMSPPPKPGEGYPDNLPPEFNPKNMIRAGLDVLDHGLPALPGELTYQMAIPVAYWKAELCAVVLVLRFTRHGHATPFPMAMQVTYTRAGQGWQSPRHVVGTGWSHDPVADPGSQRDLGGRLMVSGGSSYAAEVVPGRAAFVGTGRAAPDVRSLTLVQDGREDRRPLESHFGAWVICTETPPPLELAGLDRDGTKVARLSFGPPRLPPTPRPSEAAG